MDGRDVSCPGMIDLESCESLGKLVMDNEICGMAFRLIEGIEPKEDFPALPIFQELLREGHLLIADHTRRYLRTEHFFPGPIIDRANRSRWREEGGSTLADRAHREVERMLKEYRSSSLPDNVRKDLTRVMEKEARRFELDRLPERPL